jgi:signal transduction histidine kinase
VQDTGHGFHAAQLATLFEPFLRPHPSDVDDIGIGLALARALVLAMGGDLTVESVAEVGSTFEVTLPAAPA